MCHPKAAEKLNVGTLGRLGPNVNDSRTRLQANIKSVLDVVDFVYSAADDFGVDLDDKPTTSDDKQFERAAVEEPRRQSGYAISRRNTTLEPVQEKYEEDKQDDDETWMQNMQRQMTQLTEDRNQLIDELDAIAASLGGHPDEDSRRLSTQEAVLPPLPDVVNVESVLQLQQRMADLERRHSLNAELLKQSVPGQPNSRLDLLVTESIPSEEPELQMIKADPPEGDLQSHHPERRATRGSTFRRPSGPAIQASVLQSEPTSGAPWDDVPEPESESSFSPPVTERTSSIPVARKSSIQGPVAKADVEPEILPSRTLTRQPTRENVKEVLELSAETPPIFRTRTGRSAPLSRAATEAIAIFSPAQSVPTVVDQKVELEITVSLPFQFALTFSNTES